VTARPSGRKQNQRAIHVQETTSIAGKPIPENSPTSGRVPSESKVGWVCGRVSKGRAPPRPSPKTGGRRVALRAPPANVRPDETFHSRLIDRYGFVHRPLRDCLQISYASIIDDARSRCRRRTLIDAILIWMKSNEV
jgi:hypothetical protein